MYNRNLAPYKYFFLSSTIFSNYKIVVTHIEGSRNGMKNWKYSESTNPEEIGSSFFNEMDIKYAIFELTIKIKIVIHNLFLFEVWTHP